MLGCHNCPNKPKPGTAYEKTPCATCKTLENPPPISHTREDPGNFNSKLAVGPDIPDDIDPEQDRMRKLAAAIIELVKLKEKRPQTWQIAIYKMQNPNASYADIAKKFKCKKQNVQYHLIKAVKIVPVMKNAFLIDTRFTNGNDTLKNRR